MHRRLLVSVAAALAAAMASAPAAAQPKPLTIVVPAPPGGANDSLARLLAERLQELGQPVVVLNKPGGNLVVGTHFVVASPPDGNTLLLVGNSAVTVSPVLGAALPYDPQKDLVPVTQVAVLDSVLAVHPSVAASTVQELVALTKAAPGGLDYGTGTPIYQMAVEQLKLLTGAKLNHIPYNGTARATPALLAGEVKVSITDATTTLAHIKAGKLKALAAVPRVSALPDLPPLAQAVPGYDINIWLGLFAPRGTPADVVAKRQAEVERVMQRPDMRARMADIGLHPAGGTAQQFAKTIEADLASARALVKVADIKQ